VGTGTGVPLGTRAAVPGYHSAIFGWIGYPQLKSWVVPEDNDVI
jgi:hypothetical protein